MLLFLPALVSAPVQIVCVPLPLSLVLLALALGVASHAHLDRESHPGLRRHVAIHPCRPWSPAREPSAGQGASRRRPAPPPCQPRGSPWSPGSSGRASRGRYQPAARALCGSRRHEPCFLLSISGTWISTSRQSSHRRVRGTHQVPSPAATTPLHLCPGSARLAPDAAHGSVLGREFFRRGTDGRRRGCPSCRPNAEVPRRESLPPQAPAGSRRRCTSPRPRCRRAC
jgi:hypothetical protein